MKTTMLSYVFSCMVCMVVRSAAATTILPMNLKDLSAHAELIFIGSVSEIRVERDVNAVYTYVMFSDLEIVKGSYAGATMTVRLAGGSVAGETVEVVGMPVFVPGERDVVFLAGNFKYLCPIVGWDQGRFKVKWDSVSGREVLFDSADVPVSEIRGDQLIKARNEKRARGFSGVSDSEPTTHIDLKQQTPQKRPLPLRDFISTIKVNMDIRR